MTQEISSSDFNITKKLFLNWRSPRFGDSNPTCFNNIVWEWLMRSKIGAYQATEEMSGPSPFENGIMH